MHALPRQTIQALVATAVMLGASASDGAEPPSDAGMLEQQIQTCRLVLEHEGVQSGSMRLCMVLMYGFSKNRELDTCRVFMPPNTGSDDLQRCAAELKQEATRRGKK